MHGERNPLGHSISEAVSELIRLEDEPAVNLPESGSYCAFRGQDYALRLEALVKYRDFSRRTGENPFTNPWRGTSIEMVTYETMHEIREVSEVLLKTLPALREEGDGTIGGILSFSEGICEYEELYAGGRKYVSPVFTEEMNAELAERDLAGVRNVYRGADGCGISAEDIKSPDRRKMTFEALGGAFRLVREIGGFIEQTARETGQVIPYTAEGVRRIGELAGVLSIPYAMRAEWFGEGVYENLLGLVRVRKMRVGIVNGSREDLLAGWKEEFLGFETGEILGRFERESASFLRSPCGASRAQCLP